MENFTKFTKPIVILFITFLMISELKSEDLKYSDKEKDNVPAAGSSSKKWFFGGDIGATFGDYVQISVSPLIGYRFSPQVSSGLQFIYNHSWQYINKNQSNQTTIQSNTYGGNFFVQYNPVTEFYLKGEFEYDSYTNYQTTQSTKITQGVPFLFLGAGYSKAITKNTFLNVGVKFDVLNDINSPYESGTPFFYVGAGVGI